MTTTHQAEQALEGLRSGDRYPLDIAKHYPMTISEAETALEELVASRLAIQTHFGGYVPFDPASGDTIHTDGQGRIIGVRAGEPEDDSLDTVEWLATLEMQGFVHGRDWLDKGTARVAFDDTQVIVYRFTNDRARLLEWKARFDQSVPASVIGAAIQAALR